MKFELIQLNNKEEITDIVRWLISQGQEVELYCRELLSNGDSFPWWDVIYFNGDEWRMGDYCDEAEDYWDEFVSIDSNELPRKRKVIGGI